VQAIDLGERLHADAFGAGDGGKRVAWLNRIDRGAASSLGGGGEGQNQPRQRNERRSKQEASKDRTN